MSALTRSWLVVKIDQYNRATWPFFTSNLVNSLLTEPDRDSVQQGAELDVPSVLVWSGMLVDIVLIDIWVEGSSN